MFFFYFILSNKTNFNSRYIWLISHRKSCSMWNNRSFVNSKNLSSQLEGVCVIICGITFIIFKYKNNFWLIISVLLTHKNCFKKITRKLVKRFFFLSYKLLNFFLTQTRNFSILTTICLQYIGVSLAILSINHMQIS